MTKVALSVNGDAVEADVEPRTSLADFLRQHQHLTGTHLGCEHGVCGACTVMLDGAPARSCIAFAVALDGADVRTVEGFEDDPLMSQMREAFHQEHALQCGYCTPGMLITARDIVTRLPGADEKRIALELAGNLCRCTGYLGIINAIQRVMRDSPAGARLGRDSNPREAPAAAPFRPFVARTPGAQCGTPPAQAASTVPVVAGLPVEPALPVERGWSRISDHFVVAQPRAEVWRIFADTSRVTRCMPGAEFVEKSAGEIDGRLRLAFGPIKAIFACAATIERDAANMLGTIRGTGGDERGASRAKGQVTYRLLDEKAGTQTRVRITLDYQLQGPFAQFARSGLVKDFASHLIAEFARNLSATLSGAAAAGQPQTSSFGAGNAFWAIVKARLKRWLGPRRAP